MSIELYFSNQLEQLGQKLSENLEEENSWKKDIFLRSTIIVPNSNLKKWLQMAIANNLGIAINLEFVFLEDGLWNMLRMLDKSDKTVEFLNNDMRQLMLLYLLQNVREWPGEVSLIQNYLFTSDKKKRDDYVRRT
ncbi:MAG: exodeoxyribonuclease V subunit gamma, partial [Nitrosopumilaceae archaeon]